MLHESKNIIIKFLNKNNIFFIENFDLKKKSWLKAGGIFELYIQPKDLFEIRSLLEFLKEKKIKFYIVGNLSNIIFRDGKIKTPIINLKKFDKIVLDQSNENVIKLNVCSGVSIFKLVNFVSTTLKISGLEGLVGIPGSIGGAIYMNASSYDSYISEFLKEVEFIDQNGDLIKFDKKKLDMGWRSSIFHNMKNFVILNAIFEFPKDEISNLDEIQKKIEKTKNHRIKFQEKKFPNLGSLFATKDLYQDISKFNFFYRLLYLTNKILSKLLIKFFNENSLIYYRKFLVSVYSFFLI